MTLLAKIRRQRRTPAVLGALVLAWVGIFISPCAMAFTVAPPIVDLASVAAPHHDCPNAAAKTPMSETDCCCDLDVVRGADSQETPKPGFQPAFVIEVGLFSPVPRVGNAVRTQTFVVHATTPPVYFATQRLRL